MAQYIQVLQGHPIGWTWPGVETPVAKTNCWIIQFLGHHALCPSHPSLLSFKIVLTGVLALEEMPTESLVNSNTTKPRYGPGTILMSKSRASPGWMPNIIMIQKLFSWIKLWVRLVTQDLDILLDFRDSFSGWDRKHQKTGQSTIQMVGPQHKK